MITTIKVNGKYNSPLYKQVLIASKSELEGIDLKEYSPGSVAYTKGFSEIYVLDNSKNWIQTTSAMLPILNLGGCIT